MFKRIPFLLLGLVCGLPLVYGQASQAPEWKYGLEFRVRKAGEPDFTKDTPRYGAEVFIDKNTNQWVMITDVGALTNIKTPPKAIDKVTAPKWQHGLELKCRKAGEAEFTKDTKRWGLEVFRDDNSGHWVYISETGSVAMTPATTGPTTGEPKGPKFLHGLELKCRKGGEIDFTKDTKRWGIECFKDENNGNLVYITEAGAIAVVPGAGITAPAQIKGPTYMHGLEFRVRKAGEAEFTKDTRNFGAEIFKDENTNQLIYICEMGTIAVIPGGSSSGGETKPPKHMHGLELKCRKPGETDFTKDTKRFGIEIFQDPNTGSTVFITETGSLTVPTK